MKHHLHLLLCLLIECSSIYAIHEHQLAAFKCVFFFVDACNAPSLANVMRSPARMWLAAGLALFVTSQLDSAPALLKPLCPKRGECTEEKAMSKQAVVLHRHTLNTQKIALHKRCLQSPVNKSVEIRQAETKCYPITRP